MFQTKRRLSGFWRAISRPPFRKRDGVILELLYGSGLRAAEVVGSNAEDFRDKDVLISHGKGCKERFVVVGDYARAAH
jgi:integrase/recombinase XerC